MGNGGWMCGWGFGRLTAGGYDCFALEGEEVGGWDSRGRSIIVSGLHY